MAQPILIDDNGNIILPGRETPSISSPTVGPQTAAADQALIPASGGLAGYSWMILIPCYNMKLDRYYFATLDHNNFDTETSAELYFHQEDTMPGREITVSKIMIFFRDLGKFKLKATIETAQSTKSKTKTFGGKADGKIKTDSFDFVTTGERPQLILSREADWGPVALIGAKLTTDVEIMEQV